LKSAFMDQIYTERVTNNLVGGDGEVVNLFFEEDVPIISGGGLAGIVGVGHDGHA